MGCPQAESVETIGELNKSMTKQNDRISSTKDDMDSVVENVNDVDSSTRKNSLIYISNT